MLGPNHVKEIGGLGAWNAPCPDDHNKLMLRSTKISKAVSKMKGFESMAN
jgi:hypothetical protein